MTNRMFSRNVGSGLFAQEGHKQPFYKALMPKNPMRLMVLVALASCSLSTFAGKWDWVRSAGYMVMAANRNPEATGSFIAYLLSLILVAIPVSIVSGIVAVIGKSVFEWDSDTTKGSFFFVGILLLVIWTIIWICV